MKRNSILRFGLLILGFVFLANPNVNIIDILPDAIGCLCIVAALFKVGDLSSEMGEAKRAFLTLFWITLSKLPAFAAMLWITGTNVDESSIRLVFAFCYAALEVVFGIRAFTLLFDAFAYIGTRHEGGEFLYYRVVRPERQKPLKNGKVKVIPARIWRLETLSRATSLFFIVKAAMYTLPEITTLSSQNSLGDITPEGLAFANFYPLLAAFAVVVALVFGIVWLCRICAYTRRIAREKAFWKKLYTEYEGTVLPRGGIFTMRRTYVFTLLVSAAALFSVDLYLDQINCLPDFISAILFFIAACVIAKEIDGAKWLKAMSLAYFATSVVTYALMIRFTDEYAYSAVHKIARAKELYAPYAISNAVTQIAFIAVVFALAAVLMRIVRAHTGINAVTGTFSGSRPLQKVYAGRAVRLRIFGILAAIMSVLYFYFVVDVKSVSLRDGTYGGGGYLYFPKFEIVWMVDFTIAMIFAVFTCNLVSDLLSEVRYKYKYE